MSRPTRAPRTTIFVVFWEFHVKVGREKVFERIYGSRGKWARLFRRSPYYLGTALCRVSSRSRRYITVDLWTSRAAYNSFRRRFRADYANLDSRCASLPLRENLIGHVQI